MRFYTAAFILFTIITILPDFFFYLKLKKHKVKAYLKILNFIPTVFFISIFILMKFANTQEYNSSVFQFFMWLNFAFLVIYIPKLVYLIFHFINYLVNLFLKEKIYLIRYAGIITCMFIFVLFLHGAFVNTKNIEVKKVELNIDALPPSFENFKIVQISDIHLGSWGNNKNYFIPVINQINNQDADILVFTGDIVNNFQEEMQGWKDDFLQLNVKYGKYAILGNHDYGDYSQWKSPSKKKANLDAIEEHIKNFGFKLLKNETVKLRSDSDFIDLIGVENWGKPPFPKYGNLKKALQNSDSTKLKILLSHDPSHWQAEIVGKEKNIFLTLAGHTHAAQMAFNMYGKLRSPSSFIYKEWDGLYNESKQFLYVNRGLGFIGIPMRMGAARPEITVITLHKKS
ncbi:metallophosphoesterase [Paludibacter sp.]